MITVRTCPDCGRGYTVNEAGKLPLHLGQGADEPCTGSGQITADRTDEK